MTEILLWLFVMNLGTAFGAGLYEQQIILPQWFDRSPESGFRVNSEAMRRTDAGRRFWAHATTVPLTLLTLASLPAAWSVHDTGHAWWFGAASITLLERIMTFVYFIPTALKLMRAESLTESVAGRMASRWTHLNYFCAALTLIAWMAALNAFSLMNGQGA